MKIWHCKIGEVDPKLLVLGADLPMRQAVGRAYQELTGRDPDFVFSGWDVELDPIERVVAEDRQTTIGDLSEAIIEKQKELNELKKWKASLEEAINRQEV